MWDPNSLPSSQNGIKNEKFNEVESSRNHSARRKASKELSQAEEESFIEKEKQRRAQLSREQGQQRQTAHQSSQLMLLPKFCDKKNVLKKISMYVKSIIFSQYNWISRSHILTQIYQLDQDTSEFTYSNAVTRSNLKRRVYDSINVLYASDIVERRVENINYKKEYFFKPKVVVSKWYSLELDVLRSREEKQVAVKEKLKNLHLLHNKYLMKKDRFTVLDLLVKRNQRNDLLSIKKLDIGDQFFTLDNVMPEETGKLNKRKSTTAPKKKETSIIPKTVSIIEDGSKEKVRIPFYFYKLKSLSVGLYHSTTYEGKQRLTLVSKSPPSTFLFEDFEIIKKLI